MRKTANLVFLLGASLLSGCSSLLSPVETITPTTYLLQPNTYELRNSHNKVTQLTLLVAKPTAPTWINNTHIIYQQVPNQLKYFSKNQWADTPPNMLQPLLIQALQHAGYFHAVVPAPFTGYYDEHLDMQILDFSQDFTHHPSHFSIRLQATLINSVTDHVMATSQFAMMSTAPADTPAGGVSAANRAISQLLPIIVKFTVSANTHLATNPTTNPAANTTTYPTTNPTTNPQ